MKEIPLYLVTQDLTEFEVKLFKMLREYINEDTESEKVTNEEIVERIKKAFHHDTKPIHR